MTEPKHYACIRKMSKYGEVVELAGAGGLSLLGLLSFVSVCLFAMSLGWDVNN